ncbi:MAG: HAD family hydrolase [Chloroflexi bacterium]|nr:HAD family hydrolase [Chloroflexota bacterium]
MYQAVVFDLFGTLAREYQGTVYTRMAERLGIPQTLFWEHWSKSSPERSRGGQSYRDSLTEMCQKLGLPLSAETIEEVAAIRLEETKNALASTRPGAREVLSTFSRAAIPLGLLSNATPEVAQLWPSCGLGSHFKATVFSCEVGMGKPEPEIYRLVCGRLGVKPEYCLYVGDGADKELEGAAAAGMTSVQIRTTRQRIPEARYFIESLQGLLPILGITSYSPD